MEVKRNDIPMIPKYQAEKEMMHMSKAIKNITIVSVSFAVAFVIAILIFVNGYTARTKDWLNTLTAMQHTPAATEVQDGIQQQPGP